MRLYQLYAQYTQDGRNKKYRVLCKSQIPLYGILLCSSFVIQEVHKRLAAPDYMQLNVQLKPGGKLAKKT